MSNDLKLLHNDFQKSQKSFENEKIRLRTFLHGMDIIVEHIGSTSIPNTIGKGILDILVICPNRSDQSKLKDLLVSNGYRQGELDKEPDGRLFFYNSSGQTQAGDVHLHLVIKDSDNLESIAFRNYLIKHPEEVQRYNEEKIRLSEVTGNSRHDYAVQKGRFIKHLMRKIVDLSI